MYCAVVCVCVCCGCGVVLCVGGVSVGLCVGVCGVQGVCVWCDAFKDVCLCVCLCVQGCDYGAHGDTDVQIVRHGPHT